MEEKKLNEDLKFLMEKIGLNCKFCDAHCCKIITSNSKNLNIILNEQDEAFLLKRMLETNKDLIKYEAFDARKYASNEGKYVVKKIEQHFDDLSEFIGLEKDHVLKLENGFLKIPVMNFREIKEEKNNEYLSMSACTALNTKTNRCEIHDENPLFCKLFPYYLEPVIRKGAYNSRYFSGYFSIKITPCNESIENKIKNLGDADRALIKRKIHEILRERENFLARLTAFYEFNTEIISNFESSNRISL
ncbi:MAG: YkgJ family cysteine cluster protein [Candidatus Woesearchaeota archaeon]